MEKTSNELKKFNGRIFQLGAFTFENIAAYFILNKIFQEDIINNKFPAKVDFAQNQKLNSVIKLQEFLESAKLFFLDITYVEDMKLNILKYEFLRKNFLEDIEIHQKYLKSKGLDYNSTSSSSQKNTNNIKKEKIGNITDYSKIEIDIAIKSVEGGKFKKLLDDFISRPHHIINLNDIPVLENTTYNVIVEVSKNVLLNPAKKAFQVMKYISFFKNLTEILNFHPNFASNYLTTYQTNFKLELEEKCIEVENKKIYLLITNGKQEKFHQFRDILKNGKDASTYGWTQKEEMTVQLFLYLKKSYPDEIIYIIYLGK